MKNITAPRTLAECEFVIGHQAVEHAHHAPRRMHTAEWVTLVLFIGFIAALSGGWL